MTHLCNRNDSIGTNETVSENGTNETVFRSSVSRIWQNVSRPIKDVVRSAHLSNRLQLVDLTNNVFRYAMQLIFPHSQMAASVAVAAKAAASTKFAVHLIGAGAHGRAETLLIDKGWTLDQFKSAAYKTLFGTKPPPPSAIDLYFHVTHGQRKLITIPRFTRFLARGRQPNCSYVFVTRGTGAGGGGGIGGGIAAANVAATPAVGGGAGAAAIAPN